MAKRNKKQDKAGAPIDNLNAEKWTLETAKMLLNEALLLSMDDKYTFIGTLCKALGTNRHQMYYLCNEKFATELKDIYQQVLGNIESNCFEQAADGRIKYQPAILSLKSFHRDWTEKVQTENLNKTTIIWNEELTYEADKEANAGSDTPTE